MDSSQHPSASLCIAAPALDVNTAGRKAVTSLAKGGDLAKMSSLSSLHWTSEAERASEAKQSGAVKPVRHHHKC